MPGYSRMYPQYQQQTLEMKVKVQLSCHRSSHEGIQSNRMSGLTYAHMTKSSRTSALAIFLLQGLVQPTLRVLRMPNVKTTRHICQSLCVADCPPGVLV